MFYSMCYNIVESLLVVAQNDMMYHMDDEKL